MSSSENAAADTPTALETAIPVAFRYAEQLLQQSEQLLFLYTDNNGEKQLADVTDCRTQDEVLDKIRAWTAQNPAARWFVQVGRAQLRNDGRNADAVIAHCAERGHAQGVVVFQLLTTNAAGKPQPTGDIKLLSRIPNDFFPSAA